MMDRQFTHAHLYADIIHKSIHYLLLQPHNRMPRNDTDETIVVPSLVSLSRGNESEGAADVVHIG